MADYGSTIFLISIVVLFVDLGCSGIIVREAPSIRDVESRSILFFSLLKKIATSSILIVVIGLLVHLINGDGVSILIALTVTAWAFSKFTAEATKGTLMPVHSTIANSVIPQIGFFGLILVIPLDLFNAILCLALSRLLSFVYSYVVLTTDKVSTLRKNRVTSNTDNWSPPPILAHSTYMIYGATLTLIPQIFIPMANLASQEKFAAWLVIGLKVSILYKTAHQSILTQYLPKMLRNVDAKDKSGFLKNSNEAASQLRMYGLASLLLSIGYSFFLEYTLGPEYSGISYLILPIALGYLITSTLGPKQYLQAFLSNFDRIVGVIVILIICCMGFLILILNTNQSLTIVCLAVISSIIFKAVIFHLLSNKKLDSIFLSC
ncbi:hypothetical protein Kalk_15540 [Ketobacter alkanivorans]|uniref:Uncharacterized protein n=2 Tax=Ketobacter alkanivorans TaxID=1917421 RepID=A0A2K9LN00_9GAMM|nr:hypothetical protein Kalk_15540 [Ketobacter alkanivorans]